MAKDECFVLVGWLVSWLAGWLVGWFSLSSPSPNRSVCLQLTTWVNPTQTGLVGFSWVSHCGWKSLKSNSSRQDWVKVLPQIKPTSQTSSQHHPFVFLLSKYCCKYLNCLLLGGLCLCISIFRTFFHLLMGSFLGKRTPAESRRHRYLQLSCYTISSPSINGKVDFQ